MRRIPLTKAQFDEKRASLDALADDWVERECIAFDEAVGGTGGGSGTIWRMPRIDSKRVLALLVELEPVIGCDLPCSLIRRGGYASQALVVTDLMARIRERCADAAQVEKLAS